MQTIHKLGQGLLMSASLALALSTLWSPVAPAQGFQPPQNQAIPKSKIPAILLTQFNPPPGQGTPQNTAGSASRGRCMPDSPEARPIALSPTRFMGLTGSELPTIWVYVPNTHAKTLEFSLYEDKEGSPEGIYQTDFPLGAKAGLMKVTLPHDQTLKVGQNYYWRVALVCNPQKRPEDLVVVDGWLKRQSLSQALQSQLKSATPEQKLKLYNQAGLWYEAVNTLVELRRTQPSNPRLLTEWIELMKVGGLEELAQPMPTSQFH